MPPSKQASVKKKPRVTLADLIEVENRVLRTIGRVRDDMLAPDSIKSAPTYSSAQLMAFCELDKGRFDYLIRRGDLPNGRTEDSARRRFTVKDVAAWCMETRPQMMRPSSSLPFVMSVVNFKGGATKTSTAVALAQGLALRGHKVLVIDTDAQSSLTNLFGMLPAVDVRDGVSDGVDRSLLPLFLGEETSIDYAVQDTYWPGIKIIASNLALYSAEFALPSRQKENPEFEFWNVLRDGIKNSKVQFDIVVIDTPPSLSYTTINAMLASDGLIMPLPPSHLDFLSSGQFWSLINELMGTLIADRSASKEFAFVNVLLSRVDANDTSSGAVKKWIQAAYSDMVMSSEIPKTSATSAASAEFGTVYDLEPSMVNPRTYRRAFDAYESMVTQVERQIVQAWAPLDGGAK